MQSHGRSLRGLPAALCFLLTRRPLPCGRGMAARSRQPPPQHPLDLWGTVMAPCCALRTENLSCPTPGGCPRVPHLQLPAEPHSPCHSPTTTNESDGRSFRLLSFPFLEAAGHGTGSPQGLMRADLVLDPEKCSGCQRQHPCIEHL